MKRVLILGSFVVGNFAILIISFLFLTIYTTKQSTASSSAPLPVETQPDPSYESFATMPAPTSAPTFQVVAADDSFTAHGPGLLAW